MNTELLYTLIKESLTNISPRLLVQLTQDSSNAMPAGTFTPSFTRRGEGEDNASSLIRSADPHPCLTSTQGGASSRGLYFHRWSGIKEDQGMLPRSVMEGFSWGADNGNFGS